MQRLNHWVFREVPFLSLFFYVELTYYLGFPDASVDKEFTSSTGDIGDASLIPGSGRCPGGDHGNPFQCSCLGNPMDRGTWWATAHMVTEELDTTEHVAHTTYDCHVCRSYTIDSQVPKYFGKDLGNRM